MWRTREGVRERRREGGRRERREVKDEFKVF